MSSKWLRVSILVLCSVMILSSCENVLHKKIVDMLMLPTPEVSLDSGTYHENQSVTVSCEENAQLYCVLKQNGQTVYKGNYSNIPLEISGHDSVFLLEVTAKRSDRMDSETVKRRYHIIYFSVADPTFTPAGGTYSADQEIVIESITGGGTIYYTTDGSDPWTSETRLEYIDPVPIAGDGTTIRLKSYAEIEGMPDSNEVSAVYTIDYPQLSQPEFSHDSGTYAFDINVSMSPPSGAPAGTVIYYTTDSSEPIVSATTQTYNSPIGISGNGTTMNIQAVAVAEGYKNSDTAVKAYYIYQDQTDEPTSSPATGSSVASGGTVTFSVLGESDALIFFTVTEDGSVPPPPIIEGHTDSLGSGVDRETYTVSTVLVYKYRNNTAYTVTASTGSTVRFCVQAKRQGLEASDPVYMTFSVP